MSLGIKLLSNIVEGLIDIALVALNSSYLDYEPLHFLISDDVRTGGYEWNYISWTMESILSISHTL